MSYTMAPTAGKRSTTGSVAVQTAGTSGAHGNGTPSPTPAKVVMSDDPSLPVQFDCAAAPGRRGHSHEPGPVSFINQITTILSYSVLMVFGWIRDFFAMMTGRSRYFGANLRPKKGYAPLLNDWENFFTRRMYHRVQDCWNRPIAGPACAHGMKVMTRVSTDNNCTLHPNGRAVACTNLGSYNYLGFADDWQSTCQSAVEAAVDKYPISTCSARVDSGNTPLHCELERAVAAFLNKPAAIVFNMGYMTNASSIPSIIGKGGLIVSDAFNHTSIVNGARASGATIRPFEHNSPEALEAVLREAIVEGQPKTGRAWKKILVVVEGIYSMEGDICKLKEIVTVAKKYKAYMYLDEAHSIGCLGKTGRGVTEYAGVDTADIDIMMGTFTKSFGAMGGYIAGSQELIDYLRTNSANAVYGTSMAPAVVAQTLRAFRVLTGEDGTTVGATKLAAIRNNANYFRMRLMEMGLEVYGDWDSPVIPVMLYQPSKTAQFSRECLQRGVAVVVVGFPATPLMLSRARFCISAGHSKGMLDHALAAIEEVAELLMIRYQRSATGL